MSGWLDGLPPFEDLKSLFAGLTGVVAACYMAWLGATRGKPTPAAVAEAVKAATCGAPALTLELAALKAGQAEIQRAGRDLQRDNEQITKDLDYIRDTVNRIEAVMRAR